VDARQEATGILSGGTAVRPLDQLPR